jgi:ABC-2 type transport system ATP-binding protein
MLEFDGLSRRYGDTVALDDLSFSVPRGEVVGFVGPNGAGKTTAMRIAVGVLEPDAGEVRWDERPLDDATRRRFGYMPEERGLYPKMQVERQLRYLVELHGAAPEAAASAAGEWIERLGLSDRAHEKVEALSLGNQQRVQLAAALVHRPDVLILDEPFSGLDPIGVDLMSEILFERAADGTAAVFSSHQLELVERICRRVVIIVDGRVVAEGEVDELRSRGAAPRLRLEVEGAGNGWAADVQGAQLVEADGEVFVFELASEEADQELLYAAQIAGRLRHFSAVRPSLSELFRDLVPAGRGD